MKLLIVIILLVIPLVVFLIQIRSYKKDQARKDRWH